jgi:hypothetical protein
MLRNCGFVVGVVAMFLLPGSQAWTVLRDEVGVRFIADPADAKMLSGAPRRALDNHVDDIRRALLDYHNEVRNVTAAGDTPGHPGATNMNRLAWDPALAQVSQNYADTCVWAHNPNRVEEFLALADSTTFDSSGLANVGENLAFGTSIKDTVGEMLVYLESLWYEEYVFFRLALAARCCVAGRV